MKKRQSFSEKRQKKKKLVYRSLPSRCISKKKKGGPRLPRSSASCPYLPAKPASYTHYYGLDTDLVPRLHTSSSLLNVNSFSPRRPRLGLSSRFAVHISLCLSICNTDSSDLSQLYPSTPAICLAERAPQSSGAADLPSTHGRLLNSACPSLFLLTSCP